MTKRGIAQVYVAFEKRHDSSRSLQNSIIIFGRLTHWVMPLTPFTRKIGTRSQETALCIKNELLHQHKLRELWETRGGPTHVLAFLKHKIHTVQEIHAGGNQLLHTMMCFANGKMRTVSEICEWCSFVLHGVVCHQNRGVSFAIGSINLASFWNIAPPPS